MNGIPSGAIASNNPAEWRRDAAIDKEVKHIQLSEAEFLLRFVQRTGAISP